jgi:hypothetical protein
LFFYYKFNEFVKIGQVWSGAIWASHFARQIILTLKSGFSIKIIVRNPNERQAWKRQVVKKPPSLFLIH